MRKRMVRASKPLWGGLVAGLVIFGAVLLLVDSDGGEGAQTAPAGVADIDSLNLTQEVFERVVVEDGDAAGALMAPDPAVATSQAEGEQGGPLPSLAEVRVALSQFEDQLASHGLHGQVTVWPTWGLSYRGNAPGFSTSVHIEVQPSVPGTLDVLARREAAAYSFSEEDLPEDSPIGPVWLSDHVAYGHNSGSDPDEWAAVDLGEELYLVRVIHQGGDQSSLLGRDVFIPAAAEAISVFRDAGFSRASIGDQGAVPAPPELGAMIELVLTASCQGDTCQPIYNRRDE